jgi:predicted alpha/beta hydrolase
MGLGEDLPLDVYREWRHWCQFPRYFFDDPDLPGLADEFARVTIPIVAANATDDAWAPAASRDAFMAGYRSASVRAVDIDPAAFGLPGIGHMGYFRANAEPLWRQVIDWFDEGLVQQQLG